MNNADILRQAQDERFINQDEPLINQDEQLINNEFIHKYKLCYFVLIFISFAPLNATGVRALLTIRNIALTAQRLLGLHKILGPRFATYDPQLRVATNTRKSVVKKRPCFFLHGFNNDSTSQVKKFYDYNCLAGDTIFFNFPDVVGKQQTDLRRTSLSQENDVFAAITALRQAHEEKLFSESIDIYGYSRGAGTAGNLIHVLANPTKAQEKKLEMLEINEQKRKQLLEAIKKGSVILDRPLVHLRACLQALGKYHANQFLERPRHVLYKTSLCQFLQYLENNSVTTAISKSIFFTTALLAHYSSMGIVTRFNYSPFGLNLWESSNTLRDLGIKTLLHFQHHDEVVSNEYDISLYEKIAHGNPNHTYVIFGDNGGHNCKPYDLIPYAHTFRERYGGSFDPYCVIPQATFESRCKPDIVQHEPFIKRIKKYFSSSSC